MKRNILKYLSNKSVKVLLLMLVMVVSYIYGYQKNSDYTFHISTKANHLALQTIVFNVNNIPFYRKEGLISVDTQFRNYITPIKAGSYKAITIYCDSPERKPDIECLAKDIYISDATGNKVFIFNEKIVLSNHGLLTVPMDVVLDKQFTLYQIFWHILPICLIFCIFFSFGYQRGIYLALWFGAMYIYVMLNFLNINTGTDAVENVNVARYLFSNLHYYSYVEYRGYVWFFLLSIINLVANLFHIDFYYCYALYGCVIFTLLLNCGLIPFVKKMGANPTFYNVLFLVGIVIFLYGPQFFCPLPDITPLFFLLMSIACLLSERLSLNKVALGGIFIAISCLIRSNYYLSFVFLLGLIFFKSYISIKRKALFILLFLFPVLILSITNRVFTAQLPISLNNSYLTKVILFKGMKVQKTEAFEINDLRGSKILEKENISNPSQISISKYLYLVSCYPLDFLSMYTIRFFNGLDIKYSQVYVSGRERSIIFSLINYILVFFGFCYVYKLIQSYEREKIIYMLVLAIPSLCMVSSFVEPRYFLSLSIMLVAFGALTINIRQLANKVTIINLTLFIACCITVSASVYNQYL